MGCVIVSSKARKTLMTGYVTSLLLYPHNLKGIARLYNALVFNPTLWEEAACYVHVLNCSFLHHTSVDSLIFSYHRLDNVKIHKCTKFQPNIPCGSRVMSFFIKRV